MLAFPDVPLVTVTLIDAVLVKFTETACKVETPLPETLTVLAELLAAA
jgi:hypothetical protein